jgi:hypothetical protein
MPDSPRYTDRDLCSQAAVHGLSASRRLIDDWVSAGLLDRPQRHGLGRGMGSEAWWWAPQLALFLALLQHRREVTQIAPLCNIPIWIWLTDGDSHVPLRQVRRALRTWGGRVGKGSLSAAREQARRVVGVLSQAHARTKDQRMLQEAASKWIYDGTLDSDKLLALVRPVIDPHMTGRPRGPTEAPLTPEGYVRLVTARVRALNGIETIDDALYYQARDTYRSFLDWYWDRIPQLAADPDLGRLFSTPDLSQLINKACLQLITSLGLLLPDLSLNQREP